MGVVVAGTLAMAAAYTGTDGGGWMQAAIARLAEFQVLFLVAAGTSLLAGTAAAFLGGSRRPLILGAGGVAGVGAVAFAIAGDLAGKLGPWLDAQDWVRITLLVTAGASWGLGWGCATALARIRPPLWNLALPFLAGGMAIVALSGSPGGAIALAWLLVVATALGAVFWKCLPVPRSAAAFRPPAIVAFALGIALLETLARILGMLHLAHASVLAGVLAILPLLLLRRVFGLLREAVRRLRKAISLSPAAAMLAGTLGAILLAQWIAVLAPEVGGDSTGGRVSLPAAWIHDGVISARPEIVLSYMSIGGEVFFMLLFPMAGACVAKVAAFACLVAVSASVLGRGRGWTNPWAIAAATLFAGSTIVWWQLTWGFCDLLQALLILGAAEALRRWLKHEDPRQALAAGLLAGASAAVKLNGVLFMVAVVGIPFVVLLVRGRGIGAAVRVALSAAIPAMLLVGPALVRSAYLTGNPVFPFANGIFKSPLAPENLVTNHYGFPLGFDAWRDIYRVFLEPQKFVEVGTYHPFLLPLFAGAASVSFLVVKEVRFWIAAFLVSALFWLVTEQNLRYSLFVGMFATIAVARTASALGRDRGFLQGWVPSLTVGLVVFAGLTLQLGRPSFWLAGGTDYQALPLRWAIGRQTADAFLRRNQSTYALAQVLNKSVGRHARVWQMPWIRDHLYFECEVVSMPHGDLRMLAPLVTLLPGRGDHLDPARVAATLRSARITHLLVDVDNPWEVGTAESTWTAIYRPSFTDTWLDPMGANQSQRLYRLRETPRIPGAAPRPLARVPLGDRQETLPVAENRLYEFLVPQVPEGAAPSEVVDLLWFDRGGTLVLFQRHALPPGGPGRWHRWWQSTPPGACRLTVHATASHPGSAIEVREIPVGSGAP